MLVKNLFKIKEIAIIKTNKEISQMYLILSRTYQTFDKVDDPWMTYGLSSTPFRCLVSVSLSTMTITKRVVNACVPLFKQVSSFEELRDMNDDELREIIKPVAHYNRKTILLKKMSQQIIEDYNGVIPDTHDELMKLAGVGRKVADIMMNFIFKEPTIAVDTHILRLLNRFGITQTKSAEVAADIINTKTPKSYKLHAHEWLIQHGQQICVARKPKCEMCVISKNCEKNI